MSVEVVVPDAFTAVTTIPAALGTVTSRISAGALVPTMNANISTARGVADRSRVIASLLLSRAFDTEAAIGAFVVSNETIVDISVNVAGGGHGACVGSDRVLLVQQLVRPVAVGLVTGMACDGVKLGGFGGDSRLVVV